jgi:hypothetical protein
MPTDMAQQSLTIETSAIKRDNALCAEAGRRPPDVSTRRPAIKPVRISLRPQPAAWLMSRVKALIRAPPLRRIAGERDALLVKPQNH